MSFELDYASDFKGQVLREKERITLVMGQRLFQCDSRFTLDGAPASKLEVAIGLSFQGDGTKAHFSANRGNMMLWETVDGHGLGTGIVIDPAYVVEMKSKIADQRQALCLARTDDKGGIRWFCRFRLGRPRRHHHRRVMDDLLEKLRGQGPQNAL